MQMLIQFLGFTTTFGIIWNILAYAAFIGIIIGVFSEKYRFSDYRDGFGSQNLAATQNPELVGSGYFGGKSD